MILEPKEKAKELVDKFTSSVHVYPHHYEIDFEQRKKLALICVDEMIKSCFFYNHKIKKDFEQTYNISDNYFITYWQEVKLEIIKLSINHENTI